MKLKFFGVFLGVLVVTVLTTPADAGRIVPFAYQVLCATQPDVCERSGAPKIKLTTDSLETIQGINLYVNATIHPRVESTDVWTVNPTYGDCEDYALTKRLFLARNGVPTNAMNIGTLRLPNGEGHAVLVINTDKGRIVLDNLTNEIVPYTSNINLI